ncbi:hypothetical protein ACJX0J_008754, partial [Zea mays]
LNEDNLTLCACLVFSKDAVIASKILLGLMGIKCTRDILKNGLQQIFNPSPNFLARLVEENWQANILVIEITIENYWDLLELKFHLEKGQFWANLIVKRDEFYNPFFQCLQLCDPDILNEDSDCDL